MSRPRAVGVHTYFGGLALGYMRNQNIKTLGSLESWKPAVTWAPKLGVRVSTTGVVPRADVVISNPPCARFSAMSYSKFGNDKREQLETFPEMIDPLVAAKYSGAELVHIESGPLMFTSGQSLIEQFNDILEWEKIYTLVLKVCTRHAGLPQLRPRTHVFVGKRPFPELDFTPAPLPVNVGEFLRNWNGQYNFEPVPSSEIPNPVAYAGVQQNTAVFLSTRPKIVSASDRYIHSVVSSRHFAWLEEERWFSVDEYAAFQGYPANGFNYAEPGISVAMALISKSVSPSIAEYLSHKVTVPYFDDTERTPHRPLYVNLT